MLFCFKLGKDATEATEMINSAWGDNSVGASTIRKWFSRFCVGNFNLQDNPRPGPEKKFEDEELQALLNENPCQTQQELGKQLWVTQAAIVHAIEKIHKEGEQVPNLLTKENKTRKVNICLNLLSRYKKKNFLHKVITGDENWIAYNNPK